MFYLKNKRKKGEAEEKRVRECRAVTTTASSRFEWQVLTFHLRKRMNNTGLCDICSEWQLEINDKKNALRDSLYTFVIRES